MSEISSAPVKRLLVESSGGMRVSGSALDRVVAEAESYVRQLGKAAGTTAAADHRKTIQDSDIAAAVAAMPKGNVIS